MVIISYFPPQDKYFAPNLRPAENSRKSRLFPAERADPVGDLLEKRGGVGRARFRVLREDDDLYDDFPEEEIPPEEDEPAGWKEESPAAEESAGEPAAE